MNVGKDGETAVGVEGTVEGQPPGAAFHLRRKELVHKPHIQLVSGGDGTGLRTVIHHLHPRGGLLASGGGLQVGKVHFALCVNIIGGRSEVAAFEERQPCFQRNVAVPIAVCIFDIDGIGQGGESVNEFHHGRSVAIVLQTHFGRVAVLQVEDALGIYGPGIGIQGLQEASLGHVIGHSVLRPAVLERNRSRKIHDIGCLSPVGGPELQGMDIGR